MNSTDVAIAHVDADCFYASAERVRFAELRGVPVAVLGNLGSLVIAKSYEMKAHGIKTGMPIWEAAKLCPNGVYLQRDFVCYEAVSDRMLALVKEYSPKVEKYSIDESFFEVHLRPNETYLEHALSLQSSIKKRVGVPVSIGIGPSRTLAKLQSDTAKPFGASVLLDPEAIRAFLKSIPVTEIAGIAGRRAARLESVGITTCLDFADADRRLIRKHLTASGEALWWELRGIPAQPIHTKRPAHKVLARGGNFSRPTDDPIVLHAWFVRNLERVVEELQYHQVMTQRLTVCVSYRSGESLAGTTTLTLASDRFETLVEAGRYCLERCYVPRLKASRMHVIAQKLQDRHSVQIGLFESPNGRWGAIADVKQRINKRHGRFAVRSGSTLPLYDVYQDLASKYDICDVRGKTCF